MFKAGKKCFGLGNLTFGNLYKNNNQKNLETKMQSP